MQKEVSKVLTLGVNKVIALGHSGFATDKLIAQKVRGVDVVVGGHTNTFLYTGEFFHLFSFVFVFYFMHCVMYVWNVL